VPTATDPLEIELVTLEIPLAACDQFRTAPPPDNGSRPGTARRSASFARCSETGSETAHTQNSSRRLGWSGTRLFGGGGTSIMDISIGACVSGALISVKQRHMRRCVFAPVPYAGNLQLADRASGLGLKSTHRGSRETESTRRGCVRRSVFAIVRTRNLLIFLKQASSFRFSRSTV
jgi:hypothetical protein